MGKIIAKKIHGMNLWTKVTLITTLTLLVSTFMYQGWYKPGSVMAVAKTYYVLNAANGTSIATNVTSNLLCGTTANNVIGIGFLGTNASTCTTNTSRVVRSNTGILMESYLNTAYATNTTVTGTSFMAHLRDGNSGGWTAQFQLFYVSPTGVKTNFSGNVASFAVNTGLSLDTTVSLAGQTAVVPAGSKLGIRVTASAGTSTSKRLYLGGRANNAGTGSSGVLIVDEVAQDTTPPAVTAFVMPTNATNYTVPITTFTATDAVGVTGYLVNESATPPAGNAAGWLASVPANYTFSGAGTRVAYAWAKDAQNNVSASLNRTVTINMGDITAPTITAFSMPGTAIDNVVSVTSFTATDVVGVTGYMITESSTPPLSSDPGWLGTAPATYTFSGDLTRTAFAYVKDQAGNVGGGSSATVTITYPRLTIGTGTGSQVNQSINAGGSETVLDAFSLGVDTGTPDVISRIVVSMNDSTPVASVRISNSTNTVTYATSTVPNGNNYTIDMATNLAAPVGTPNQYLVWITPKSIATFPVGPGQSKTLTGTVTSIPIHTYSKYVVVPQDTTYATLTITNPSDPTPPTITAFVMPTSSIVRKVPVTTFTASDNIGVAGYMVNEDPVAPGPYDARWSATPPANYTFAAFPQVRTGTVYAWAKDGAGNVSLSATRSVSLNLPPPQSPMAHSSGNLSEKYGSWGLDYNCATCHVDSGMPTTNIKKVRETITTPTGSRPVVFNLISSSPLVDANSFGNDLRTDQTKSTNVCEVCHHQTMFHQYSASKVTLPADPYKNHNYSNNGDCQMCHSHNLGFKFSNGSCDNCHGYPPVDTTIGTTTGLATPPTNALGTAPANASSHYVHVVTRKMACDTCHSDYLSAPMPNYGLHMGIQIDSGTFPGFQNTVTGGTFYAYSSLNSPYTYTSSDGVTNIVKQKGISSCNVYCHGSWNGKTPPAWTATSQTACGSCHGDTSTPPTTGSHIRHFAANGANLSCAKCHPNNLDSSHIKGSVSWDLSGISTIATYKPGAVGSTAANIGSTGTLAPSTSYGTCSTNNCHGAGTPTWGANTATVDCEKCHGSATTNPFYDTAGNTTRTGNNGRNGAHTVHLLSQTAGRNYTVNIPCTTCHTVPTNAGDVGHFDNYPNAEVNITGTLANKGGAGYNYTTQTCSTVWCHGAGMTSNTAARPSTLVDAPTWSATLMTGVGTIGDGITTTGTGNCATCHGYPPKNTTTHQNLADATKCATCHLHVNSTGTGFTAGGLSLHLDGTVQIPSMDCNGCHDYDTTSGGTAWGKNQQAAGGYGAHARHIEYLKKRNNASLLPASDTYGGTTFNKVCGVCHVRTETNEHKNSARNINFGGVLDRKFGASNPSYNTTLKTCSNIDCHYKTSPTW